MNVVENKWADLKDLPLYRSNKIVRAGVIKSIANTDEGGVAITFDHDCPIQAIEFPPDSPVIKEVEAKSPEAGWYLVVYEHGYRSFSPPGAFVLGYSPQPENKKIEQKEGE